MEGEAPGEVEELGAVEVLPCIGSFVTGSILSQSLRQNEARLGSPEERAQRMDISLSLSAKYLCEGQVGSG